MQKSFSVKVPIISLIYSPFGYRVIRSLRPPLVKVRRDREMPTFNKNFLENLCSEVNLIGYDEDDKIAIIQTMRTVINYIWRI
jgi:hypothetical protein